MIASRTASIARTWPRACGGRIVVVGVGGAGVATLAWLADAGGVDADLVAIDTSAAALDALPENGGPPWRPAVPTRILLPRPPRGESSPEAHADAVDAIAPVLECALRGADLVFVVGGLAGATGGGAAPAIGALARAGGALTVGFGLAPFSFEPAARRIAAAATEAAMVAACDAVVVLDGDLALGIVGGDVPLEWAATAAREVVRQTVIGVSDFADRGGCIQVGHADLARLLRDGGRSCVSIGSGTAAPRGSAAGSGAGDSDGAPGPAELAVAAALDGPFADRDGLAGAARVLCQITGGADLALADVDAAIARLTGAIGPACDLQIGVLTHALLPGTARATVIGAAVAPASCAGVLAFPKAPAIGRTARSVEPAATADVMDAGDGIGMARERPVRALAAAG